MVQERIYSYFERNPQLHVLFIFDKMNINFTELEDAKWSDNYIYKVFDGAWFNVKYAIENTWKDKRVVLLFTDGTYPHTEEQMLKFPLLDMLKANMEYKEDDYASFMQQYNLPEKFRLFVKNNVSEMQSTKISTMLAGHLTPETFSEDIVSRALISSYLGEKKLLDWEPIIIRMLILGLKSEEKKRNDFFHRLSKNLDARKAVDAKLNRVFGRTYNPNSEQKMKEVAECLKYNSITQLLEAAPGDNYKQYKVTNAAMIDSQNKVYEYGIQSRQWSEKFSQALAELGKDIKEEAIISAYGIDAQYNYMPEALCWPILKEVLEKKLMTEPDEVNDRMRNLSLKFSATSNIQIVIRFTEQVALYYEKVKNVGTMKLNTPDEYVQLYINELYLADMFYRHSLEAYHDLVTKENPIEQTINNVKSQLDQEYAKLTNVLNLEWLTCVKEREDIFGSLTIGKQENLYQEEATPDSQVFIISDALRYEVAVELYVTVVLDGIAQRGSVVQFGAAQPGVGGVVLDIHLCPIEDGQLVERQLVGGVEGLLIVERRAPVADALPDGVFPGLVVVGVEVFVDGGVRLLNLGVGGALEVHVQVLRQIPADGEVAVPEELLAERQGQVRVLGVLQVALLQFVVVAGQLGVERDA